MTHEESIKAILNQPENTRRGQVWIESWKEKGHTSIFLVLGACPCLDGILQTYELLNLETGLKDWIYTSRLDQPDNNWKRLV